LATFRGNLEITMTKLRVLCLLRGYPTLCETYKENELRYLQPDHEVMIASFGRSQAPYEQHYPYKSVEKLDQLKAMISGFRPNVIHGHYLHTTDTLFRMARAADAPFTVRTHSFDVLGKTDKYIRDFNRYVNSDFCAGLLAFPFLRETLVRCGMDPGKIVDAWPVVDYERFHDRSPNGDAVMNTGACIPKKKMRNFIDLGLMAPELTFSMYPVGYASPKLTAYNEECGSPVNILETVEPFDMPAVYKAHRWMVYTGNPEVPTVGWPCAVAEAQAAGVGVLIQRVREDLLEYVGPGGYVYDTLDEARDIIRSPFPEAARQASFEHARRSDIRVNLGELTAIWRNKRPVPSTTNRVTANA
jgi:hypothetical protein